MGKTLHYKISLFIYSLCCHSAVLFRLPQSIARVLHISPILHTAAPILLCMEPSPLPTCGGRSGLAYRHTTAAILEWSSAEWADGDGEPLQWSWSWWCSNQNEFRTSLNSLSVRKLLDLSCHYFACICLPLLSLLSLPFLTGPYWALLGLSGPY